MMLSQRAVTMGSPARKAFLAISPRRTPPGQLGTEKLEGKTSDADMQLLVAHRQERQRSSDRIQSL